MSIPFSFPPLNLSLQVFEVLQLKSVMQEIQITDLGFPPSFESDSRFAEVTSFHFSGF